MGLGRADDLRHPLRAVARPFAALPPRGPLHEQGGHPRRCRTRAHGPAAQRVGRGSDQGKRGGGKGQGTERPHRPQYARAGRARTRGVRGEVTGRPRARPGVRVRELPLRQPQAVARPGERSLAVRRGDRADRLLPRSKPRTAPRHRDQPLRPRARAG